jgi:hypothetical protein
MVDMEMVDRLEDQAEVHHIIQAEGQLRGTGTEGTMVDPVGRMVAEMVITVVMIIKVIVVETGVGSMKIGTQDRMDLQ